MKRQRDDVVENVDDDEIHLRHAPFFALLLAIP